MLDKLTDEVKKEIRDHALEEFPKECCGILIPKNDTYKVVKCENLFKSEKKFLINPEIFNNADNRNFSAIYHSHTDEKNIDFSPEDELVSNKIKKDFIMYNVVNEEFKYYAWKNLNAPILNRIFFAPVFDCVALVVDYYKEFLNIDFKIKDHWNHFLNEKFLDFFIDNEFRVVDSIKKHDIIIIKMWKDQEKSNALEKFSFSEKIKILKQENKLAHHFFTITSKFHVFVLNSENTCIGYDYGRINQNINEIRDFSKELKLTDVLNHKSDKIFLRHASLL